MTRRILLEAGVVAVLLCTASGALGRANPPGGQGSAGSQSGAISGVVVDGSTGAPLGYSLVTLFGRALTGTTAAATASERQQTDGRGRLVFRDLQPGSYRISVSRIGYFVHEGQRGLSSTATFTLGPGEWVNDLRLALWRPSSISGTVRDERGQPIVGTAIRALGEISIGGRTRVLNSPIVTTDDRGMYRIPNLAPGRFTILRLADAVQASEPLHREALGAAGTAYPLTYYPGARDPRQRLAIDLQPGQERLGMDFFLEPVRTRRLAGRLLGDITGLPGRSLRLVPESQGATSYGHELASQIIPPDGTFDLPSVPEGRHVLEAMPSTVRFHARQGREPDEGNRTFVRRLFEFPGEIWQRMSLDSPTGWIRTVVEIGGDDLLDLTVPVRPSGSLSGRVVFNDPQRLLTERQRSGRVDVYLEPVMEELGMPGAAAELRGASEAVFAIRGLLGGEYYLVASSPGIVQSIQWNGQDYTDRPFDASMQGEFSNVTVTITSERVQIEGTVHSRDGAPAADAAVICFPADAALWDSFGLFPRRLGSVLTDDAGQFSIRKLGSGFGGLPAGDYLLVAVDGTRQDAWIDRAFLKASSRIATRIRADWGTTTTVNLRLQEVTTP